MPRNQKEGLLFSLIMSAIMIYVMAALNECVRMQSLEAAAWLHAAETFVPGYLVGIACDVLLCSPLSRRITFAALKESDSDGVRIFVMRFCMVIFMTVCMTVYGSIVGGARGLAILSSSCVYFPYNFTIAMPLQMLIVAPLSIRLVGRIFGDRIRTIVVFGAKEQQRVHSEG